MEKHLVDHEASRIIDSLGGTGDVARLFDVDSAAVSQWRRKGIPRARLHFLRFARPELFSANDGSDDAPQDVAPTKGSPGVIVEQATG